MALSRKSNDSSVEIVDYPVRKRKILRKFHFILPKFYFILPKFYFPAPWKIFICSLEILNFLGRDWLEPANALEDPEGDRRKDQADHHNPYESPGMLSHRQIHVHTIQ